jgi:hypothetical protein
VLARNLANGVIRDERPDVSVVMEGPQNSQPEVQATAHWGNDGIYYHWYDGGEETTAFVLRALLALDPNNPLVDPAANWLIRNRRGAQWRNTRDTSIAVLALNDYLTATGELRGSTSGDPHAPVLAYQVRVNGAVAFERRLTAADLLAAPSRFTIPNELIRDGANQIRIERTLGDRPVYFGAEARFYSFECPVPPAGNELFVRRQYIRQVSRPTLLKRQVLRRVALEDGAKLQSGERVEVVLTVEAKNNLEYLVFEDLKPAGFEAVDVRSGPATALQLRADAIARQFGLPSALGAVPAGPGAVLQPYMTRAPTDYTGQQTWAYQELRDRHVALFVGNLPQGVWELRYELRAEVPGEFHALPTRGYAMYVPEIRCNGTEVRVEVQEK